MFSCHPSDRLGFKLVGYLAAGLVNTSLAADRLVASTYPAREAAAAGFILTAMVQVRLVLLPRSGYIA